MADHPITPDQTVAEDGVSVSITINDEQLNFVIEPRLLLSDFIRHTARLTGTHVGCEHGVCGACTVLVDGKPQRSCLIFAVQVDGAELTTVEGLASPGEQLHPVQSAFAEAHGLQCGFCTPGFLLSTVALLEENHHPSDDDVLESLSGNLCRCTGYRNIVSAVELAASKMCDGRDGCCR